LDGCAPEVPFAVPNHPYSGYWMPAFAGMTP
jgi:hypothetical protein